MSESDDFKNMLEEGNYEDMINYCEDVLDDLCSGIEEHDYEKMTTILEIAAAGCDSIFKKSAGTNIGDKELKLLAEYVKDDLQYRNKTEIVTSGEVDKIEEKIAEYWMYSSLHSFMYASYNIGERLQKSIVYDPDLINKIEPIEAWYLCEIYFSGYITKNEINKNTLDVLIGDELKLCSNDKEGRVFLTNMGVAFFKNEERRIMDKLIKVVLPVEDRHILGNNKNTLIQVIKMKQCHTHSNGEVHITSTCMPLMDGLSPIMTCNEPDSPKAFFASMRETTGIAGGGTIE